MRAVLLALALLLAAPAGASAARVELLVVGKTRVLREAAPVRLKARSVRVGRHRCAVGRATPLSVLAGTRLALRLRDYGACGRSPADAGSLYVRAIGGGGGRGAARRGFKGGRPAGAARPAAPSRAVGDRRLEGGARGR